MSKFQDLCFQLTNLKHERFNIGTLSEKTMHRILKFYICNDKNYHEIKINRCVADICINNQIYEIQSKDFKRLRTKLKNFLPSYNVCIVHPIVINKQICYYDKEKNETSSLRKSPKKGNCYEIFEELFYIKEFLLNPALQIKIFLVDAIQYKLVKNFNKAEKYELFPTDLLKEINIVKLNDYLTFLPPTLPLQFTSLDFKKCANIPLSLAQYTLNVLSYIGVIKKIGNKNRYYLYEITLKDL